MSLTRRRASSLLAGAAALGAAPRAFAQASWPDRPVHLVVTFIAGGANDIIARIVADRLSARLGQQFVIDNKGGAGGNLGVEYVAHQPPDGYTFVQLSNAAAANASLYPNVKLDILTDLAPVAGVYDVPFVLVVAPDFPAKTLAEFVAWGKANPGKITHGSGGVGSVSHVSGELFKMMTGIQMTHVPYRGSPPELGDIIGGRLTCAFDPLPTSLPYLLDGRLRALGITSARRSPKLPDVPAIGETLEGYEATSITGTAAPKGAPDAIIQKLSAHIGEILAEPEVVQKFDAMGATPLRMNPTEFGALLKREVAKWAKVVKFADLKPE